jgi:ParB-like chromosome segregation protein Spo0J
MSSKQHKPLHPLCQAFPAMDDEAFEQLRDDIAVNGQRNPILLYEDQILDGRHRLQACLVLGIEPRFQTFTGTWEQAKAAVCSENLHRRHLTTSQRAMIAASLATLSGGRPKETELINSVSVPTLSDAAETTGVSRDTVVRAKRVQKTGAPEVAEAVRDGKLTINKAQELIAAAPAKEAQAEAVATGKVDEVIASARPKRDPGDPPPLPRTNTHHTADNRRQPDSRDSDRMGFVSPDDPRDLADGGLYRWSEDRNRLLPVTDDEILQMAEEIHKRRGTTTKAIVEPKAKAGKVPTAEQLQAEGDEFLRGSLHDTDELRAAVQDWAAYKQSLTGDAKVRSMESWKKALTRIERVATEKGVSHVCDLIERAIASGFKGWEHDYGNGKQQSKTEACRVRSGRNWGDLPVYDLDGGLVSGKPN